MKGLRRLRNRLLGSVRFQRLAAAFPLTRPIVRVQTRLLFDLCAGFVYAQTLQAVVQLDLPRLLAEQEAMTLSALAGHLGLPPERLDVLLRAAVALRLLEREGEAYALGPRGAVLLGNPGLLAMIRHHALFYRDLADPLALLRDTIDTDLARYWAYAKALEPGALDGSAVSAYSTLMASSQEMLADSILDAYPFARHRVLLDIGGGLGAFVAAVARRAPAVELHLWDLPAVAEQARAWLGDRGLARASVHGGDAFRDALPVPADLITLVRIIHDHDDANVMTLLRAIRQGLPASGALVIAEPMAETRGAEAMGGAYFGFYLLAMGSGRPRSRERLVQMLNEAGFRRVREQRTANPLLLRVLVARP
ncbi:MAG: methyltransferase [Gammaproteobacteria bacterium]|nr:methyltransferase [Gammaproteobacteria bacterium]